MNLFRGETISEWSICNNPVIRLDLTKNEIIKS